MLESNSPRDNRLRLIADDDKKGASAPFSLPGPTTTENTSDR